MNLGEASKSKKRLSHIECTNFPETDDLVSISFFFHDGSNFTFCIDEDTDEIIYTDANTSRKDMKLVCPEITKFYGMTLIWSWEMINQQGYFDAAQMEFSNDTLTLSRVLQLKVVASTIYMYTVEEMQSTSSGPFICRRESSS
jgi:hypothetical protein